ncbi:MAG: hypothetical protein IJE19_08125 [Clostridia bacterium]|nr:hypothetical protein [Clostridia bacterium]
MLDNLYARAVYLEDNRSSGGVIFCTLDCVGMSRKDINDIRKYALESGRLRKSNLSIYLQRIPMRELIYRVFGVKIYKTGKDQAFMDNLKKQTRLQCRC